MSSFFLCRSKNKYKTTCYAGGIKRAEGIESEKLAIAKRLKDAGQSIEFIMEITLLDKEIIEKI